MLSGGKFNTNNNKNTLIIKLKTIMDKETQIPTLSKTAVSGSFFSIYYTFNGMKMWLSLLKNEDGSIQENCVSHQYRRMTYTSNLLKDKIKDLQREYPKNEWHFEEVL